MPRRATPVAQQQLRLEYVPLTVLQRAPRNPKEHATAAIRASINRHGFVEAPIVDERTGFLLGGHGRLDDLEARKAKGEQPPARILLGPDGEWLVPTVYGVHTASDTEAEALLVGLNQLPMAGGWQPQGLYDVLDDLAKTTMGLEGTGFTPGQLDDLLVSLGGVREGEQPGGPAGRGPDSMGSLARRFVVPPFSVLDTRQGYWQDRKREWLALGIRSELGRGEGTGLLAPQGSSSVYMGVGPDGRQQPGADAINGREYDPGTKTRRSRTNRVGAGRGGMVGAMADDLGYTRRAADARSNVTGAAPLPEWADNGTEHVAPGTSIFDPVLCEIVYRWFSGVGAQVLDPFAGGSVRGVTAGLLGRAYTGVDLRAEQVAANEAQAAELCTGQGLAGPARMPAWVTGDSRVLDTLLPDGALYDLVFTCPPYFDLEVYSDDPADLSRATGYPEFLAAYEAILVAAAARLRPDRFAVLVVSEIRDPAGIYRGLVPDTILAARRAGLELYNEAVLINAVGSLPLRAQRPFVASRKLGRTHQQVLVFVKGSPERATVAAGPVEIPDLEEPLAPVP